MLTTSSHKPFEGCQASHSVLEGTAMKQPLGYHSDMPGQNGHYKRYKMTFAVRVL